MSRIYYIDRGRSGSTVDFDLRRNAVAPVEEQLTWAPPLLYSKRKKQTKKSPYSRIIYTVICYEAPIDDVWA